MWGIIFGYGGRLYGVGKDIFGRYVGDVRNMLIVNYTGIIVRFGLRCKRFIRKLLI